jgi:hypothetical protein
MGTVYSPSVWCPDKRRASGVLVSVSNVLESKRAPEANAKGYK